MTMSYTNIILDSQQQNALEMMLGGKNVFLTGKAGTGKTAVIHEFDRLCDKNLVKLAYTGVAAQAISGSTIHSTFNFSTGVLHADNLRIDQHMRNFLGAVDVLLVDEGSLVRSDCFNAMDLTARKALDTNIPFGGKQIVVVGDYCQLSPVASDLGVRDFLKDELGGIYAFETNAWEAAKFETIELDIIHRQNDREYTELLNAVRQGNTVYPVESSSAGDYDDGCLDVFTELNRNCFRNKAPSDAVHLCCTRGNAGYINAKAIKQLDDPGLLIKGEHTGIFPEHLLPTNYVLAVKRGMRVMLLRNKKNSSGQLEYSNGSLGTVISYENEGRPQVKVELNDGRIVKVGPNRWENLKYNYDKGSKSIMQRTIGSFVQLPIAPAYAITIHKAQGKTISKAHLVQDKGRCFAPGQLYVALSRVPSMKNLTIDKPILGSDVIVAPEVLDFYGYPNPRV